MYMLVDPIGDALPMTVRLHANQAKAVFIPGYNTCEPEHPKKWKQMYRRGWRCIPVKVTPA